MAIYYLKRKSYSSMPYDPKPRIRSVEGCPFVEEEYSVVLNNGNPTVDENAIMKLFKDPKRYIVPKVFEYEKDYDQGRKLGESDFKDLSCFRIDVNGPRDIEFYVRAIPGTKVYKFYGPLFTWHLVAYLGGTSPEVAVIEGLDNKINI